MGSFAVFRKKIAISEGPNFVTPTDKKT